MCGKYYFLNFYAQFIPIEPLMTQHCGLFVIWNICFHIEVLDKGKIESFPLCFTDSAFLSLHPLVESESDLLSLMGSVLELTMNLWWNESSVKQLLLPSSSEILPSFKKAFYNYPWNMEDICKWNFLGSFYIEKLLTSNWEVKFKENNNKDLKRVIIILWQKNVR